MSTPSASGGNPFRAILDVGAALVSSLELDQVFANVAEKIGEAMMVWSVDIQTYDRERNTLLYEAYWSQGGLSDEDRAYIGTVVDIRTRPDWLRVVEGGEVVEWHINDPALPAKEREAMQTWGYKTTLDAPLMVGDQVIGILGISETRFVRTFTSIEKDLFSQLSDLAAVAIHNAQVYRRQREQTRHLDALVGASRAITSSVVFQDVMQTVAKTAAEALGTQECVIYEHDPLADAIIWRGMYPMAEYHLVEERVGTVYPLDESPADRVILNGGVPVVESISDADLPEDTRVSMNEWGEKTCLNVPLMFKEEPVGIMVLIEKERERRFSEPELDLVRALGEQAAMAIRNAQAYERQQEETRRVSALLEAGKAITSTVDPDEVLARVTCEACNALGVKATSVYEYDARTDLYCYRALHEVEPSPAPDEDDPLGTWYSLADYPGDRQIMDGHDVIVHDLSNPDLPPDRRESMTQFGEQTTVNVPLRVGDERLGILRFYVYGKERHFTDSELQLARGLGEQAAIAIANARLYARIDRQKDRLAALLDVGRAIGSTVDLDEVLERVTREACLALDVSATAVYEYDRRGDRYTYRAAYSVVPSPDTNDGIGTTYEMAAYPGDRTIMLSDGPVVHHLSDPDLPADRRASMEYYDEQAVLSVPLRFGDERLGILRYYVYAHDREFGDDEIALARGIGEQAAIAIANARLYERIDRQKDRLTSLLDAGRAITSTVVLDEVLARITREATLALDASQACIYYFDSAADTITYKALFEKIPTPAPDDAADTVYDLDDYPGDRALLLAREPVVHQLTDPDLSPDRREGMAVFDEHTTLNVPLWFGDRPLGILRLYEMERPRIYTESEIELATGLGEQAAIAIVNARLYEDVGRQQARLSSLLDAGRALTSTLVPKEVFDTITQRSAEAFGSPRCALYEYDPAAATLTARSIFEPEPTPGYYVLDVPEPISLRPADKAILDGSQVVVESIGDQGLHAATRAEMEFWGETTVLNVPLSFVGAPLGILMVIFTGDERTFSDDELTLAAGLGEQAATAIYNARLHDSVERERQRSVALFSASRMLTSSLVRDDVLALVTERAAETLQSPRCDLYEYDSAADTLTLRGYFEEVPTGLYANVGEPEPLDERPGDRLILEGGEVMVQALSDPALDPATRAEMEEWGEKTCLNVPLVVKGEPLGILIVTETERERLFSDDEIEFARGFGEQVGMALQNARLYRRLETQNQRLLNLLQSSRVMTGGMNVEKAVATMCSEMANLLDCPACHIDVGLRRDGGDFLPPEVFAAEDEVVAANREPPLVPDELTERALSARQPQQSEDDPSGSRLVIPLLSKDEPSGFVELSGPLRARFGEDELEVVQILANQAATAIDNARMYQDQERQAITDGLTGLFNHRFFYDSLRSEMARSLRYFTPLSLLILDVDDFKTFNDTYGHVAGDEALREIGRLLRSGVREHIDIACRYGGEEFAVILPNTPVPGARAAGERLQGEFARAALPDDTARDDSPAPEQAGEGGTPLPVANPVGAAVVGERIRATVESARFCDEGGSALRGVTVSVGVAAFPDHGVSGDALVAAADKALYVAKRRGKNRVEVGETTS
jgi:diguanylate cyclase (GGDEF)-like protein